MFKKILKALWSYKIIIAIFLAIGFFSGYFVAEFWLNESFSCYEVEIKTNNDPITFMNYDYFKKVEDEINEYNNYVTEYNANNTDAKPLSKITYYACDYKNMLKDLKIEQVENHYLLKIPKKYFPNDRSMTKGTLIYGIDRCSKFIKIFLTYDDSINVTFINSNIAQNGPLVINSYLLATYVLIGVLVILIILFTIAVIKDNKDEIDDEGNIIKKEAVKDISDNVNIFRTPFHKKYWTDSLNVFKSVKNITGISILFALSFLTKFIAIPSGFGALGIGVTYLFLAIISMIYGPICALVIGFSSDVLGYFVIDAAKGYAFFPGYTLDAMVSCLMYAFCFYKTKITFTKCLISRLFVNLVVNVIFGSLWWKIIYSLNMDAYLSYMLIYSLPKNLIYLLPQSILLFLVIKALSHALHPLGYMHEDIAKNISLV